MNTPASDAIKKNYSIINLESVSVNPVEVVFVLDAWTYLNYRLASIEIKMCWQYIMLKVQQNKDVFVFVINISKKHINLVL